MSAHVCPVHKTPLLPEGIALLTCPDCDYTIMRASLGAPKPKLPPSGLSTPKRNSRAGLVKAMLEYGKENR